MGNSYLSIVPLGRRAKAKEVSEVILFVASGKASYITGSIVPVDGGILAGFPMPSEGQKCKKIFGFIRYL